MPFCQFPKGFPNSHTIDGGFWRLIAAERDCYGILANVSASATALSMALLLFTVS